LVGRAYALLHWYKVVEDDAWLRRAFTLADRAAVNVRTRPLAELEGYENSLYKGEVGVAALLADCARPERAALPFFESEGWPARS
jgi:serine/threonine-protein kinase